MGMFWFDEAAILHVLDNGRFFGLL